MGKFEQVVSVCVVVVVSPKPGLSLWLFKYSTGATELCVTHVKEGRGKQSWSQAFNTTACNMSKIKWESSMSVLIHICIRHTQQDGGGGKNSTLWVTCHMLHPFAKKETIPYCSRCYRCVWNMNCWSSSAYLTEESVILSVAQVRDKSVQHNTFRLYED